MYLPHDRIHFVSWLLCTNVQWYRAIQNYLFLDCSWGRWGYEMIGEVCWYFLYQEDFHRRNWWYSSSSCLDRQHIIWKIFRRFLRWHVFFLRNRHARYRRRPWFFLHPHHYIFSSPDIFLLWYLSDPDTWIFFRTSEIYQTWKTKICFHPAWSNAYILDILGIHRWFLRDSHEVHTAKSVPVHGFCRHGNSGVIQRDARTRCKTNLLIYNIKFTLF